MNHIYIHIPFCKQLCYYCDFYFSVSLLHKPQMIDAICREIDMRANETTQKPETLYFGGGTPSVCNINELKTIVNKVKQTFGAETFREFTIEANPDDLTDEYLNELLLLGANRLSIGIQSFNDEHLRFMNRRHTAEQAVNCVKAAKRAGFSNINIDLIYGFQNLTCNQWRKNIDIFFDLDVPHLSAYHLGIEPRTVFYKRLQKGEIKIVDEETSIEQYQILEEKTAAAGFEHYEISNFARNGLYAIHNTAYWQGEPYLGFGPSAHSYNGKNTRRWNIANNKFYIEKINSGQKFFDSETLNTSERYDDYILTSLRTMWGVDTDYIKSNFGLPYFEHFGRQAQRFLEQGLLVNCSNNKIKIPSKHFLMSDGIIRDLFY